MEDAEDVGKKEGNWWEGKTENVENILKKNWKVNGAGLRVCHDLGLCGSSLKTLFFGFYSQKFRFAIS